MFPELSVLINGRSFLMNVISYGAKDTSLVFLERPLLDLRLNVLATDGIGAGALFLCCYDYSPDSSEDSPPLCVIYPTFY